VHRAAKIFAARKNDALPFQKRSASFSETKVFLFENDALRFVKGWRMVWRYGGKAV